MTPIERQILKALRNIQHNQFEDDKSFIKLNNNIEEINELLNPKQSEEPCCEMPEEEEVDCNCGFKIEEGKKGCGKVFDELVERDDDENIIDTRWIHCGEDGELCEECVKQEIEE